MEELVVNGGAEDGLDGWVVEPGAGTIDVVTSPTPIEGSQAFRFWTRLGDVGEPSAKTIHQYRETVPGTTYEGVVSFNGVDGDAGGGGNNHVMHLELDLEGLGFNTTVLSVSWIDFAGWASHPFSFVALSATTGIRIHCQQIIPDPLIANMFFYADALSISFVPVAPVLGLRPVRLGELLDQVAFDAGDFSAAYRNNSRTWLNLARAYIANQGFWRTALNGEGEINVSGANTNGIYALKDASTPAAQVWAFVEGDTLVDVTDNRILTYQDPQTLMATDPNLDYQNSPLHWTDKGYNSSGEPQIMLYPRPTVATTIKGSLYKQFASVDENQDDETIDPYFGPVDDWAHCFAEGLRYYKEQDENEIGTNQQWLRFTTWVEQRKRKQGIASVVTHRLRNLRHPERRHAYILADPQHFDNPEV